MQALFHLYLQAQLHAPDLSAAKHHVLLFGNKQVRVYRLTLAPAEATTLHRHARPYAYVSLQNVRISYEVPGRKPKVVDALAGEVHTSHGGFELVERNIGTTTADILIVEQLTESTPFSDPMVAENKGEKTLVGPVFEEPGMRAYSTRIEGGGSTSPHFEQHDRLLLAVTDLLVADQENGQEPLALNLKSGEVKWLPKGSAHRLSNLGDTECSFITFEFP